MKKLLLATTNKAKIDELKTAFAQQGIEAVSIYDLGEEKFDVEETGKTFSENALLKAKAFSDKFSMIALGDDGGLAIDALDGQPGVLSKRWLGREASDQELIDHTINSLQGVPWKKRTAHLGGVLAIYDPDDNQYVSSAFIDGYIAETASPNQIPGFPFRSVLWLPQFDKYYVDLTPAEKESVQHRRRSIEKLLPKIKELLKD